MNAIRPLTPLIAALLQPIGTTPMVNSILPEAKP